MTDIIERLKSGVGSNLNDEAADTIESLRAMVEELEALHRCANEDANTFARELAALRARVEELEASLEAAYAAGEVNGELAALKAGQGKPVAWMWKHINNSSGKEVNCGISYSLIQETNNAFWDRESVSTVVTPLFTQATTIPEGFSAGDMADQGAKAFREGQGTTRQKGMMLVSVDLLREVEDALGSFCSDEGWSAEDMQTMDNVSAVLAAVPKP